MRQLFLKPKKIIDRQAIRLKMQMKADIEKIADPEFKCQPKAEYKKLPEPWYSRAMELFDIREPLLLKRKEKEVQEFKELILEVGYDEALRRTKKLAY